MMRLQLARSVWRKLLLTVMAAGGFVWLYEATILDSMSATLPALQDDAIPGPGSRLSFSVTAYCKGVQTASGVAPRSGVAASDPKVLPVGSIVELEVGQERHNGIYTVLDTGPAVQGLELDLYMWSCHEALGFGRQRGRVTVLRLGWNPQARTPTLMEKMFKRAATPATPLPPSDRRLPQAAGPASE